MELYSANFAYIIFFKANQIALSISINSSSLVCCHVFFYYSPVIGLLRGKYNFVCLSVGMLVCISHHHRSSTLIFLSQNHRPLRYASPSLWWNNLPASFRQPRSSSFTTIHHPSLPLSSISDLKHIYSTNPSHHRSSHTHRTPTGLPSRTSYC